MAISTSNKISHVSAKHSTIIPKQLITSVQPLHPQLFQELKLVQLLHHSIMAMYVSDVQLHLSLILIVIHVRPVLMVLLLIFLHICVCIRSLTLMLDQTVRIIVVEHLPLIRMYKHVQNKLHFSMVSNV